MDCHYAIIDSKMKNITSSDLFAAGGISNRIVSIKYDSLWIHMLDGRGHDKSNITQPIQVFDRLSIPYELIDIEELFSQKKYDNSVLLISKDLLKNWGGLKPGLRQISLQSMFYIHTKNNDNELIFRVYGDEEDYVVSKEALYILKNIPTIPHETFYIIRLLDTNYALTKDRIILLLKESIDIFLSDSHGEYNGHKYLSGRKMYNEFLIILKSFSERPQPLSKRDVFELHFLVGSLNAGSIGFYRYDFANSLEKVFNYSGIITSNIVACLTRSSYAWREIGRILFKVRVNSPHMDNEMISHISSLIKDIESLETRSMEALDVLLKNSN